MTEGSGVFLAQMLGNFPWKLRAVSNNLTTKTRMQVDTAKKHSLEQATLMLQKCDNSTLFLLFYLFIYFLLLTRLESDTTAVDRLIPIPYGEGNFVVSAADLMANGCAGTAQFASWKPFVQWLVL